MDPTMQSPVRRTVPMPFSDGIQITLPSGPHYYPIKRWVGSISQGNTPRQAFESLSRHATPFQGGVPSANRGVVDIPGFGSVRQLVDPDHLTIVNTTEPGHHLYPGNVFRSIVQEGDNLYVVTHGYGTGTYPAANEFTAPAVWLLPDHRIRHELNRYPPLGYPMDELNTPAGIDGQANAAPGNIASHAWGNDGGDAASAGANSLNTSPPRSGGGPGISSNKPVRRLSGMSGNNPPASAFGPSAPPARFVLPGSLNSSDGLTDWIAALAGVDPQNPTQGAPSPQVDQLRGFDRDDPTQPWFVQGRR